VNSTRPTVALFAGPTASGKSARALALALAEGGTVINADSAQVYGDLGVLTARPSPEDEDRAPHRLFGHVDGADTGYSAARWAAEARVVVGEVLAAGQLPILVGGTGLYLRTLLDGIAPVPAIDPVIRAAVRALPVVDAHAALAREDPGAAVRLHPNDTTRIARALEVVRSTGRPLATWQAARTGGIGDEIDVAVTLLLPPRERLYAAILARAERMVAGAAPAEVAALLARPDLPAAAPIRGAIGVAALDALNRGTLSRSAAVAELALQTRQYAKRQYTWFKRQSLAPEHKVTLAAE
jgi:tRNA dimethylallyltransferase